MLLTARRLALFVLAGAALAFVVCIVMLVVAAVRGGAEALGYGGSFLALTLMVLVPILLVLAGVLAIRSRPATRPEIRLLIVLGGSIALVAAIAAADSIAWQAGTVAQMLILTAVVLGWVPAAVAALGALIVIVVQTIRARPSSNVLSEQQVLSR